VRVVLADGSIVKSGGQVVKNVSGYDLHKIFVGSLGTLGVIAEATLKVAPLPRIDRTFAISCSSAAEATGVIVSAHEATLALSAAELLSPTVASALIGNGAWTALVRVAGGQAATARTSDDLDELASLARGSIEEHPSGLWSAWRGHFSPSTLALRISVVPSRVSETAESLDRAFAGESAHLSATVSAGLIRLNLTLRNVGGCDLLVDRARAIAEQRGGFLVVEEAPSDYKLTIDVFGRERGDIEIMRRLKQQFDPAGILAQGRFVGRI
jgi:glycolate oxidase FAD binding subunit